MVGILSRFLRHPANPLGTKPMLKMDKEAVISSIDDSIKISDAVQAKINGRISLKIANAAEVAQKAKKAFENFSSSRFSQDIRKSTESYIDKTEDFEIVQQKLVNNAVKAANTSNKKSGIKLSLSKNQAKELGLNLEAGNEVGKISIKDLSTLIEKGLQGTDVVASMSPFELCKMEIEATNKATNAVEPNNIDGDSGDVPEVNEIIEAPLEIESENEIETWISDNVNKQLGHVTSPEGALQFGISGRANQSDIDIATENFQLHGGPADVTAFHDFYDLQIAFPHVWTELFDEELAFLGMMLQKILVGWETELGVVPDLKTISTTKELQQLIDDIRSTSVVIANNDLRLNEVQKLVPEITVEIWLELTEGEKQALYALAFKEKENDELLAENQEYLSREAMPDKLGGYLQQAKENWAQERERLVEDAKSIIIASKREGNKKSDNNTKQTRVTKLLADLERRLQEKYTFDVFYAEPKRNKYSINFGVLVNYRQKWKPINYQVGELVSTLPLAPKEIRKYSTKRIVKKSRIVKEVENSLNIKKDESSSTARDHAEIIRKANNKSSFRQTAEGGVNIGVWNAKGSHSLSIDAARQSADTKKAFRESVLKSAEEHKNENRLEISMTTGEEYEESTSGDISNPNDELPVTYLFYELQRRYEISEKLHKLTPVVLVANEVPRPDQIDEEWLTAHDWILRRIILDDSYITALDYLSEGFVGDELATETYRQNLHTQRQIVKKITSQVKLGADALEKVRSDMKTAIQNYASTQVEESGGLFSAVGSFLFGGDADYSESYRIQMETAKEAFERLEREQNELRARLSQNVTALQVASDEYAEALREQFNRRTEVLRLRAHVKDNILYYMQGIWDQEPPDQRFFRLYDVDIFDITGQFQQDATLFISTANLFPWLGAQQASQDNKKSIFGTMTLPNNIQWEKKKLVEVADLDSPLGYKGNYTIYPLKENNAITYYMMQDYLKIDDIVGAHDPDELGSYTTDEVVDFAKCLFKKNPQKYEAAKPWIRDLIVKRLSNPYRDKDTIVVPTDSLYIEALPGSHPILEDFKLIHRAVDVKKAQAAVRHDELENIRLAARSLKGEYDDPEIEKKIVIHGDNDGVMVPTDT